MLKKRSSKASLPSLSKDYLRILMRSILKKLRSARNLTDKPQTSVKVKLRWKSRSKRR